MQMPDLKLFYEIMQWHKFNNNKKGHVGIFAPLPAALANQFPSKDEEDTSPPHITVLYIGDMHPIFEDKFTEIVGKVAQKTKPFTVKLGKPKKFCNDKDQLVYHSPVFGSKLHKFNNNLKTEMMKNCLPFSTKYPEYKPHVTIEYVNPEEKPKYSHIKPEGSWLIDSVWIWGTEEPYLIPLG